MNFNTLQILTTYERSGQISVLQFIVNCTCSLLSVCCWSSYQASSRAGCNILLYNCKLIVWLQAVTLDAGITLPYLLLTKSFVFIDLQFPMMHLWLSFQGFESQSSIPEGITTNRMSYGVKSKCFPLDLC